MSKHQYVERRYNPKHLHQKNKKKTDRTVHNEHTKSKNVFKIMMVRSQAEQLKTTKKQYEMSLVFLLNVNNCSIFYS